MLAWLIVPSVALVLAPAARGETGAVQPAPSPVGVWQTVDERTGQPTGLIRIWQKRDGTLSGAIVGGRANDGHPARHSTACTGTRENQPLSGMKIIEGMRDANGTWDGGRILNPDNGKFYRFSMRLASDPNHLVVRGYVGIPALGRSQTWLRQPKLREPVPEKPKQ